MTATELHAEAADTWQDEPGIEPVTTPNRRGRGFRLPTVTPPAKGTKHGEATLYTDWRKDRIGTEGRLRAISDSLIEAAAASRQRVAELDDGED
jgi:hypothetical protein